MEAKQRLDGWENLLTGRGTQAKDKRVSNAYAGADVLGPGLLDQLYRGDSMAARVVDLLPHDMTREGWEVKIADDAETTQAVNFALGGLDTQVAAEDALTWARLYGGAVIVLGVDDGQKPDMPVNLKRIRAVRWLNVLDRHQLQPEEKQMDPLAKGYGLPAVYSIHPGEGNQSGMRVHASRLLRFDGVRLPSRIRTGTDGWGDSVLNRVYNAIQSYQTAHDDANNVISEFLIGVYKLEGLAAMLAQGGADAQTLITNRFTVMDLVKGLYKGILLDSNEEFTRQAASVAGLAELVALAERRLAAETGIPHSLLLGESPGASLGEAGNSQRTDWYDAVASAQQAQLKKPLEYLVDLLLRAKEGPTRGKVPAKWSLEFKPLWQMDEAEAADIRKTQAETDSIYVKDGVLSAEEVAVSRFGGEAYSTDTVIDLEGGRDEPGPAPAGDPATEDPEDEG